MSDTMLYGVLRMPYELAMGSELSRRQFWDRAQEAASEIERLRNRVECLRGLCKTASGWLLDADRIAEADEVLRLVGDAEPPC